jgi:protein-S-isoprenylcysteine O-methyltransferase Ste14
MNQDATFRAILVASFVAILVITLYHRLRSWESKEPLDRRREGLFILATLRPIALLLWLGVFAFMINPRWMAWSSLPLSIWLRWSGAAVTGIGIALLAWTLRNLGRNLTDTVVTREAHTLITRGPYRWVRHPFYDATALFIVGFGLIAANWFILATGALVFLLLAIRSRTEEELLLSRFGEEYRAYRESTGRFLPRWRGRAAAWIAVALTCLSTPALAQSSSGASIPRATAGAILGGVVGVAVGGYTGAAFTNSRCDSGGNPDSCIGPTILGIIWGGGIGHTVGIPLGAHYIGGRKGQLVPSVLASAAIFGAEVLVLRSAVKDGQYVHKNLAIGTVIAAPILQIISSVVFEARGRN